MNVHIDLLFRQGNDPVKALVRFIEKMKYLFCIGEKFLPSFDLQDLEIVLSGNDVSQSFQLLINTCWYSYLEFYPVHIFLIAIFLQMDWIVREIVNCRHGCELFKSFHQHAFRIQVSKTKRSVHKLHPFFFCPDLYRSEQGRGDLIIVDKLEIAETKGLFPP